MTDNWQKRIEEYCKEFTIPIQHLADILNEPKVVPMIRGKGFEYSVMIKLSDLLPSNEWIITKATAGEEAFHDTDVRVVHKRTGKPIRLECKLAGKQGYRLYPDGHSEIRVKCMRSRTLGDVKVKELAPKLGVDENALSSHRDQYVSADFDIVVTTIGNAFYRTDKKSHLYVWKPNSTEEKFLIELGAPSKSLKDFAFNSIYIAKTKDLIADPSTGIICTRKKCSHKNNCGFIPNYPIIKFDATTHQPINRWEKIDQAQAVFKSIIL
jgi:hypothetical protein